MEIKFSKLFDNNDFKLCYVSSGSAYFTTKELDKQWGDDWDDAPYEHNAGSPYTPCWHNEEGSEKYPCDCDLCKRDWNKDGSPKWEIVEIKFEADLSEPCDGHFNSPYSVDSINAGAVAWLSSSQWTKDKVFIQAGCLIDDFIDKIESIGGEVYIPMSLIKKQ